LATATADLRASIEELRKNCGGVSGRLGAIADEFRHSLADVNRTARNESREIQRQLDELRGGSKATIRKIVQVCTDIQTALNTYAQGSTATFDAFQQKVQTDFARVKNDIKLISAGSQVSIGKAVEWIELL
jgi:ABC-type transporter Mla subunit MlaD